MRTYNGLVHSNGNLLAAVDVETTGKRPFYHEVIQIAVVPLDSNFRMYPGLRPFNHYVRPLYPERAEPEAMQVNRLSLDDLVLHAPDPEQIADLFRDWFNELDLPKTKRLMPVGCNWAFESGFLGDLLRVEERDAIFHPHVRDLQYLATSINDRAVFRGETPPFNAVSLKYLCDYFVVENHNAHDAFADCLAEAEVYRRMVIMDEF